MNEISNTKKVNKLKVELGLVDKSRLDLFLENPCYPTFKSLPKTDLTPEIVSLAVATNGELIQFVPKKLITEELCENAVKQNGLALKYIPEEFLTNKIIAFAVKQNSMAISLVPKKRITKSISKAAVCQYIDNPGYDKTYPIAYIPPRFIDEKLIILSIENSPLSIKDIPNEYLTKEILLFAVSKSVSTLQYIPHNRFSKKIIKTAVLKDPLSLKYIPKGKLTKEICDIAFKSNPFVISFIPEEYITRDMCLTVIKMSCFDNISERVQINWFPKNLQDDKNVKNALIKYYDNAFDSDPLNMMFFPEQYITINMCLIFIEKASEDQVKRSLKLILISAEMEKNISVVNALINKIGARYIILWDNNRHTNEHYNHYSIKRLTRDTINYLQSNINSYIDTTIKNLDNCERIIKYEIIDIETPLQSSDTAIVYDNRTYVCDMTMNVTKDYIYLIPIYYISDLHLEHQFEQMIKKGTSLDELSSAIENKINSMIIEITSQSTFQWNKLLFIGGDVSDHQELVELFFKILSKKWSGRIIYVLGNHELWDNKHKCQVSNDPIVKINNIDGIINDYRITLSQFENCSLLQNELFITYKHKDRRIISEKQIINATYGELRDILSRSSMIILGGVGFSGLNPHYNATLGLYGTSVTTVEEDKMLSSRFKRVYDKLNLCAGDLRVIIFTHNPVHDWTTETYNPNWIYINGHTHINSIIRNPDGTTVLSDNQIGYKPSTWKLNTLKITGWYDLFRDMSDGIYDITRDMYLEFNNARGITVANCNYDGNIVLLKRNDYYMFLLKFDYKLYLLQGGRRKRLANGDVDYYYNNMAAYIEKIYNAISPYQEALNAISREIKLIGGSGNAHGCIIDIDYFNHLYLNPLDGTISAYYAYDTLSRWKFEDLPSLLTEHFPQLLPTFKKLQMECAIPILSQYAVLTQKECISYEKAKIPQLVLGTEMYEPSRVMRSVQYIFDNNVIRTWNDEILIYNFKKDSLQLASNIRLNTLENKKSKTYEKDDINSINPIVESTFSKYAVGYRVKHRIYGFGVIIKSERIKNHKLLINVEYETAGIGVYTIPDDERDISIIKGNI